MSSRFFSCRRMDAPSVMTRKATLSSSRPSFMRCAFSTSTRGLPSLSNTSLAVSRWLGGNGTAARQEPKGKSVTHVTKRPNQPHRATEGPGQTCHQRDVSQMRPPKGLTPVTWPPKDPSSQEMQPRTPVSPMCLPGPMTPSFLGEDTSEEQHFSLTRPGLCPGILVPEPSLALSGDTAPVLSQNARTGQALSFQAHVQPWCCF